MKTITKQTNKKLSSLLVSYSQRKGNNKEEMLIYLKIYKNILLDLVLHINNLFFIARFLFSNTYKNNIKTQSTSRIFLFFIF